MQTTRVLESADHRADHRKEPASGPERQVERARAVLVDDNQVRVSALAAALKAASEDLIIITAPDARAMTDDPTPADLVLLALGGREVSALATGAQAIQRNPYAEVIFYCEDPEAPEVAAAALLGITRILPAGEIAGWLADAGGLLARAARLRRAAAALIAAAPPAPQFAAGAGTLPRLPLPTAEMRFRENYLRSLLAQSGSRQEAARRAGVPYRTMCEMIRKLGIAAD
jgi:hypothetical protein